MATDLPSLAHVSGRMPEFVPAAQSKSMATPPAPMEPPRVVDSMADADFREAAISYGYDPDGKWCGGYVDYEWNRLRHILDLYVGSVAGKSVLEVGCNVGASMVVLTTLGADVTAFETHEQYIRLTGLNLGRYGLAGADKLLLLASAPPLPFSDSSFDLVCCNSVLEYMSPGDVRPTMKEIGRVLRPGGIVVVTGTSNRLWPREVHSGRWLVNYLPRRLDRYFDSGGPPRRGIFPWEVTGPLDGFEAIDRSGYRYRELHRRFGVKDSGKAGLVAIMGVFANLLGISPGRLGPNILAVLRRPEAG